MKTKRLQMNQRKLATVLSALFCLACVPTVLGEDSTASQKAPKAKSEKTRTFSGTVSMVNPTERVIVAESFWSTRTFSLGDNCKVSLEDSPTASIADLRPGQRLQIRYEDARGVRIACEVLQKNMVYHGQVEAIDPANKTIEVKRGVAVRKFALPENYSVVVKDKTSTLQDLKVGQTVDVTYESLDNQHLARRIEHKFPAFVGTIRSIDASTRTVRANNFFGEKTFRLADGCRIVAADNSDASLRDLRIGDRVEFSFEDKDGVLVANRIGHESPSASAASSETAKAEPKVP